MCINKNSAKKIYNNKYIKSNIIHAPKEVSPDLCYYILGEKDRTNIILDIFNKCCPHIDIFKGSEKTPCSDDTAFILVEPDWSDWKVRLLEAGIPAERIFIFPCPEVNANTWWDICDKWGDHLNGLGSNPISFKNWLQSRPGPKHLYYHPKHYWCLGFFNEIASNLNAISLVANHLSDQTSRESYVSLFSASPESLFNRFIDNSLHKLQYFEYVDIRPGDVVLNLGVESGFEISYYLAHLSGEGRLYNIDPLGYDYLSPYVAKCLEQFPETAVERRLAIETYDGSVRYYVDSGQALGSRPNPDFDSDKFRSFPCLTPATFVATEGLNRLDLVKIDIEGAEESVLPHFLEIFQSFRPQIALSIYHKPDHMWKLPGYLMGRLKDYSFYFSHYSYLRYESILYAIPKERAEPPPEITI